MVIANFHPTLDRDFIRPVACSGITNELPSSPDTPVLIVGGGPTGLLQAYLLSRLGIKCLLIERYPERLGAPKAHALSPRSFEICRQFGLDVSALRTLGTKREDAFWVNFVTNLGGEAVGRLPYERMDLDVLDTTPEMIHNIPQPVFEQFVSDSLSQDSNVDIRKGLSFVSLKQNAHSITAEVEERITRARFEISCRYLIACDGARSKVRDFLEIESEGEDSYETMMTIHIDADLRPVVGDRVGMLHWIMDPVVSGFVIGYDLSNNQVLICNFDSKRHPVESWNESLCREVVKSAVGKDIDFKVLSYRPWLLSRRVAKQYRKGNVFLAGDAAHAFPPTGGLGLNCGLADVHNLAWKLAFVLDNKASSSLLDTYQDDRRQVAIVNSMQSVKNGKQIFALLKALGVGDSKTIEEATKNLHTTIHDPAKKEMIEKGIEGQREHFSNTNLHIGYVYGDQKIPESAMKYRRSFVKGARLPHAWIKLVERITETPPVDLSYVNEFNAEDRMKRQFSTLDLCREDRFTLIMGVNSQKLPQHSLVQVVQLHGDFELQFGNESWEIEAGLEKGGALLVRPDQHILYNFNYVPDDDSLAKTINSYLIRQ